MEAHATKNWSRTSVTETLAKAVLALWVVFAFIPLLLIVRRLTGGLNEPLGLIELCGGVALWCLFALALRWATAETWSGTLHSANRLVPFAPTVGLLVFVGAVWLPGTSWFGIAVSLLLIGGEVGTSKLWRGIRTPRTARKSVPPRTELPRRLDQPYKPDESEQDSFEEQGEGEAFDERLWQQISHGQTEEGREYWHGLMRVEFAPGQRVNATHAAFCPPVAVPPKISAWQLDGPPAEITVSQVLSGGARFEIKLSQPASAHSCVVLEFTADVLTTKFKKV